MTTKPRKAVAVAATGSGAALPGKSDRARQSRKKPQPRQTTGAAQRTGKTPSKPERRQT